jgi:hypothetical protein
MSRLLQPQHTARAGTDSGPDCHPNRFLLGRLLKNFALFVDACWITNAGICAVALQLSTPDMAQAASGRVDWPLAMTTD